MTTRIVLLGITLALAASAVAPRLRAQSSAPLPPLSDAALPDTVSAPSPATATDRLMGWSGALRMAFLQALDALDPSFVEAVSGPSGTRYRWMPLFGTRSGGLIGEPAFAPELLAPGAAGMWRLELGADTAVPLLTVVAPVPFSAKRGGMLNGYYIGTYPTEGSGRTDAYAPPGGFIEVTPENQDVELSEHFRLRQFLTKDQFSVWPKYVVLRPQLIDKLELVLQELNRMGIRADRMYVMSGYRTPQYNGPGGDGRAALSRHMYGDAADVWVDNDADGYIDDLNGDGLRDPRDAEVMLRAVERVELKYPDLVGGAGVYGANEAHGPFIHIDVRGTRSRW